MANVDWNALEDYQRTSKVRCAIRLDAHILEFFKSKGPGYQPKINSVLKHYVKFQTKNEK